MLFQEKTCEDSASFDLTSFDIASCIEDVMQCIEIIECREHNELNADDGAGVFIFIFIYLFHLFSHSQNLIQREQKLLTKIIN